MTTEEMQQLIDEKLDEVGTPTSVEELQAIIKDLVEVIFEKAKADGDFELPTGHFPSWFF